MQNKTNKWEIVQTLAKSLSKMKLHSIQPNLHNWGETQESEG
jgi:hypothetical protein